MAEIKVFKHEDVRAKAHPADAWQCDIFPLDGTDYHATGATAEEAAARATAYWIARERVKQRGTIHA